MFRELIPKSIPNRPRVTKRAPGAFDILVARELARALAFGGKGRGLNYGLADQLLGGNTT